MKELGFFVDGLVEGRRGTLMQAKRERWVWRAEEDGQVWFAKRGVGSKRNEIAREAENARILSAAGFGPEVLAAGVRPDGAWLVTADVIPDAFFISVLLSGLRPRFVAPAESADRASRQGSFAVWGPPREGVDLAGRSIREFHDAGFAFPDLTASHTYLTLDRRRLWIIDAARLERHRGAAPLRARARDLGALLFSLEQGPRPFSRAGRLRLLRAASGLRDDDLRAFLRSVEQEILRRAARTRWRHEFLRTSWRPLGGEYEVLQRFQVRPDSNRYRRVTDPRRWEVVRKLPDRTNLRLVRRGRTIFFAKSYAPVRAGRTPAMCEFEAIERFQRAGILVNRVAAYAEDVEKGSLLAVHACRGEPLDDLLRRGVTVAERRALAVQTARVWRRMRECGLRHRDAYPCHLFVAPWEFPDGTRGATLGGAPRFELRLIDLTRAGPAPFPKERWFVKDAAQLWHGLPKPPVTRMDAVRWLREYFRVPKLTREAKRFARKVAAKERSIAAHVARKAARARKAPRAGKPS